MIDEKYVESFISTLELKCPKCGSARIDIDWKEGDGDEIVLENICDDCENEWNQLFKFETEYVDEETEETEKAEEAEED
jgi:hypothetical protein